MARLEIRISEVLKTKVISKSNGNMSKYIKTLIRRDNPRLSSIKKVPSIKRIGDNSRDN